MMKLKGGINAMKEFIRKHVGYSTIWTLAGGLALIGVLNLSLKAATPVYNNKLVNETGLAFNNTYPLNLNNWEIDSISFQVVYSSMSPTTATFKDGTQSTGSITVAAASGSTGISTTTASDFLTLLTTTGYAGAKITVGGISLTEGQQWAMDTTASSWTAISIKNAINTFVPNVVASTGTKTGNQIVLTTSTFAGFSANNLTLASNTSSITVNSANFTGGQDNACVAINGVLLCANRDWGVGASSQATASNLATTINANASFTGVLTASAPVVCALTNPCGVATLTSAVNGTASNFALFSSTQGALTLSAPVTTVGSGATSVMTGGTNAAPTFNTGKITIPSHGYTTALQVLYTTSTSNIGLTGLTWGTTYFIIPVDANTVELATTSANAQGGLIFATISSSSTQTSAHSFVLTPLTIAGASSLKYQGSNDGVTWTDLATPAPYTIGTTFVFPSTSTIVDVGTINYSNIRANVTAPTQGALAIQVIPNGKNSSIASK